MGHVRVMSVFLGRNLRSVPMGHVCINALHRQNYAGGMCVFNSSGHQSYLFQIMARHVM